jgi:hypothetical protein
MRKTVYFLLSVAAGICLFFLIDGVTAIYSVEKKTVSEKRTDNKLVIVKTEILGTLERPPVVFNHGLHAKKFQKNGCKTCHPVISDGTLLFDFLFNAENRTKLLIRDAYHEKCINCHNKMIDQGQKAAPVRCGDCHVEGFQPIKHSVCDFDFSYHDKHIRKLMEKTGKSNCRVCHHTYDPREEDESLRLFYEEGTEQSCYYCHDAQKRRGPSLAVETGITLRKGLSIGRVSHQICVNCHLDLLQKGNKAGPLECSRCHTGKYKSVAELADTPRPERDQPKKTLITTEDTQMKGVRFDHALHEKHAKTCRSCHHETLNACKKCHVPKGSPEGKGVTAVGAYHDVFSVFGCSGCHNVKKSEQNCSGCHNHLLSMDLQTKGPKKETCIVCHSGRMGNTVKSKPVSVDELNAQKIPEKVIIKILEKEYNPVVFPHLKIIKKLVRISNDSRMAVSFHRNYKTICSGCHHQSISEAEAVKNKPPYCRNCHPVIFDPKLMNRPRLLAVYHRQCMGCHEKMKIMATGCTDCHKEKVKPVNYLSTTMQGNYPGG